MRMIEAKREIEEKLFVGAPLSFDTMMCALVALSEHIDNHGDESFVDVNVAVDDGIKEKATEKLMSELQKGVNSGEIAGYMSAEDVKRKMCYCEEEDWDG